MRLNHFGLRAGIACAALALALSPVFGTGAGASGPSPTALQTVAQGINVTSLPGVTAFGPTPANTPETVSFILDENNVSLLEQSVDRGLSSYLSVTQFAQLYGQSASNIAQLESYLAKYGITSQVYPGGVDVVANGTAGQFDKALSDQQNQYYVPRYPGHGGYGSVPAQTVHGANTAPQLPSQIAQYVLAILGLTNYSPYVSQTAHVSATDVKPQSGSTSACLALTGLPDGCNLPSDFASNYGLSQIESAGANGHGQTLAIVTLAAVDPGAPQYFWSNVLHLPNTGRTLSVQNIDGGPGAPEVNSIESDIDVEQSGGVAPGANVVVYQAPNTDSGYADAFFAAASQNTASSVSTSWGESETFVQAAIASGGETSAYNAAFDEAFLELAAQGQSAFAASGDAGAYDASDDLGTTNLAVDTPADSPYITAAGGTTLPWSGTLVGPTGITASAQATQQRAWGWDYLWQAMATTNSESLQAAAESNVVGDGGGFSSIYPTPSYQYGVSGTQSYQGVQYFTPTAYENVDGIVEPTDWNFTPTPNLVRGGGSGRAVPDLSTDADPFSGYEVYAPSFVGAGYGPAFEGAWGGTSFVAPQLNGSAAVIDSYVGHRVGLWNPSIYAFATSRNSPFNPLQQVGTSNDNIFYTGTPGAVFNEATGLGVPNLSALARDFATGGFGGH